jgi:hypothetical protein
MRAVCGGAAVKAVYRKQPSTAVCMACPWTLVADGREGQHLRELRSAAKRHASGERHEVIVGMSQKVILTPVGDDEPVFGTESAPGGDQR